MCKESHRPGPVQKLDGHWGQGGRWQVCRCQVVRTAGILTCFEGGLTELDVGNERKRRGL